MIPIQLVIKVRKFKQLETELNQVTSLKPSELSENFSPRHHAQHPSSKQQSSSLHQSMQVVLGKFKFTFFAVITDMVTAHLIVTSSSFFLFVFSLSCVTLLLIFLQLNFKFSIIQNLVKLHNFFNFLLP